MTDNFSIILQQVRSCRRCAPLLPHEPQPILRGSQTAKLLIVGQAPGLKVHQTGLSFNDASGNRLRQWLHIDRSIFYDEDKVALIPMGLCYPGRHKNGADLPPLKICAPLWHSQLLTFFQSIELILLVGGYAQKFYLKSQHQSTLTETVRNYQTYLPRFFPLPHPSWRNTGWLGRNPWFEKEILPDLRIRIHKILSL